MDYSDTEIVDICDDDASIFNESTAEYVGYSSANVHPVVLEAIKTQQNHIRDIKLNDDNARSPPEPKTPEHENSTNVEVTLDVVASTSSNTTIIPPLKPLEAPKTMHTPIAIHGFQNDIVITSDDSVPSFNMDKIEVDNQTIANIQQPSFKKPWGVSIDIEKQVSSGIDPILTSAALANDSNLETMQLEKDFLSSYHVKPHRYYHDDCSVVIFSRTLNTHYLWPTDKPLHIKDLEVFAKIGHTLGVDNSRSYFRRFTLDLDCLCRKNPAVDHLTLELANTVMGHTLAELKLLTSDTTNIVLSLWRNQCGFHIYSNIGVSLPTHLFLAQKIIVHMESAAIKIEVPTIMPLPYSAKVSGSSYQPVNNVTDLRLTNIKESFLELYEYNDLYSIGYTVININTLGQDLYMSQRLQVTETSTIPRLLNVLQVSIERQHECMDQMIAYITQMAIQYTRDLKILGVVDFSTVSASTKLMFLQFLNVMKVKFGGLQAHLPKLVEAEDSTENPPINMQHAVTCNHFVYLSTVRHGCLYLEPFAVALCKMMKLDSTYSFEDFRTLLRIIYKNVMPLSAAVGVFIDRIDLGTCYAYMYTGEEILDCLAYYILNNIDPTHPLEIQIDRLMLAKLCNSNEQARTELIEKQLSQPNERTAIVERIQRVFFSILTDMRIVYYETTSRLYFVMSLDSGRRYESMTSLHIPCFHQIMSNWVIAARSLNVSKTGADFYEPLKNITFVDGHNVMATSLGSFNNITGLYTADTWLLCFKKYRSYCVLPYIELALPRKTVNLNELVVQYTERSCNFLQRIEDNLTLYYYHAIIIPAILQLRYTITMPTYNMQTFFIMLANHTDFSPLYFLVEYYPFDPNFIYLLMTLFSNLETLIDYSALCFRNFSTEYLSPGAWKRKFGHVYDSAKYDENAATHFDKLRSLTGVIPNLGFSDDTILLVTFAAICMTRCNSYDDLLADFNVVMPEMSDVPEHLRHSDYETMAIEVTPQNMQQHFARARRFIFGDLDQFEHDLINEYTTFCIASSFLLNHTQELLDTISATYVPRNILKKIVLYHGRSNVGKSFLCDKLQILTGPCIGRFRCFKKVFQRAETTGENVITILNEANTFDANELKSVTGNDSESASKFFTQSYEMQSAQSLMYGATNTHVRFMHTSDRDNVDMTSIDRIYSITMKGEYVVTPLDSFFSMAVHQQYFNSVVTINSTVAPHTLGWLAFASYLRRRNKLGLPYLNTNSEACIKYKHMVRYNNNKLYRCIINSGLEYNPKFMITVSDLRSKIMAVVNQPNLNDTEVRSWGEFQQLFLQHYNDDMKNESGYVLDYQSRGMIAYVMNYFNVLPCPDSVITAEDLRERILTIPDLVCRNNSIRYFTNTNMQYYVPEKRLYRGIKFTTPITSNDDLLLQYQYMRDRGSQDNN